MRQLTAGQDQRAADGGWHCGQYLLKATWPGRSGWGRTLKASSCSQDIKGRSTAGTLSDVIEAAEHKHHNLHPVDPSLAPSTLNSGSPLHNHSSAIQRMVSTTCTNLLSSVPVSSLSYTPSECSASESLCPLQPYPAGHCLMPWKCNTCKQGISAANFEKTFVFMWAKRSLLV